MRIESMNEAFEPDQRFGDFWNDPYGYGKRDIRVLIHNHNLQTRDKKQADKRKRSGEGDYNWVENIQRIRESTGGKDMRSCGGIMNVKRSGETMGENYLKHTVGGSRSTFPTYAIS